MLPADDPEVADARFVLQHFPASERILIALNGEDSSQLVVAASDLSEKIRAIDGIKDVQDSIDENAAMELYIEYQDHLPELFNSEMRQGFEQRLKPEVVSANMQRSVDAAGGAEGPTAFDQFREDPFGFRQVLRERFEKLAGGYQGRLHNGHIVSNDGRFTLIFCEADFVAGDTRRGAALMSDLNTAFVGLPEGMTAHVIGAHRSSVDNAEVVKSDLQWTIVGSVLAILLLFLLVFRSLSPVLIAGISAGCGFLCATGLFGWLQLELTVISLGMAAALLGITVDYTVHLCAAFFGGSDDDNAAGKAVRSVGWPSGLAMLTTTSALLLLVFSNFKGMKSLALLASVSIIVAFVATMLFGPRLLNLFKGRAGSRQLTKIGGLARTAGLTGWPILAGTTIVLACVGYGLFQLKFEGDVTKLDAKSDSTRESEEKLNNSFGDAVSGRSIIVTEGYMLDEALEVAEQFQKHDGMIDFRGPSLFLPSPQQQAANRRAWKKYFDSDQITRIENMMIDAEAVMPGTGRSIRFTKDQVRNKFAGFLALLEGRDAKPIDSERILKTRGGAVLRQFILERDGSYYITSTASPVFAASYAKGIRLENGYVLQKRHLAEHMVALIRHDVLSLGLYALFLVAAIVGLKFRNLRLTSAALAPVVGGLVFTLGMMGWLGMPFNIINVMLMVFVAGLGIDYGIFLVASREDGSISDHAAAGVGVAAITTMIGFGSLTFASHPALFSVGITATMGVGSALVIALLVVPVLLPRKVEDAKTF
jgi:predicted RND superfamily exporter protein